HLASRRIHDADGEVRAVEDVDAPVGAATQVVDPAEAADRAHERAVRLEVMDPAAAHLVDPDGAGGADDAIAHVDETQELAVDKELAAAPPVEAIEAGVAEVRDDHRPVAEHVGVHRIGKRRRELLQSTVVTDERGPVTLMRDRAVPPVAQMEAEVAEAVLHELSGLE